MWGRRKGQDSVETATQLNSTRTSGAPRALSTLDELLRHAEWEGMTDGERGMLLAPVQGGALPALVENAALPDPDAERLYQDWVAQLVGTRFQPEVAGVVRAWLESGAPDGHLYVGGRSGQGRTSVVASLARKAMASRPVPPDYCYVPDVASLGRHVLLPVPKGTGGDVERALGAAIGQIAQGWDPSDDSGDQPAQGQPAPPTLPQPAMRQRAIAKAFDALGATTPDSARDYLARLRGAFEALAAGDKPLPFGGEDAPVANVIPSADDLPGAAPGTGAPVVVASLAQTELADALLRANGGVLVLQATDLMDSSTWNSLATALRARGLSLKSGWPLLPLNVRVVIVGTGGAYNAFVQNTEDFARLFRYEVWCNWDVAWTRETESAYAALADGVAARYGLPKFDATGVGRLVEEAARRSDGLNRTRLSTNLLLLHDLAAEAARVAKARSAALTSGADVDGMLARRRALQATTARRMREAILTGQELTPTAGAAIGQINGLGIYDVHPDEGAFGVPTRLSATVSVGREEQLVDIEREAEQADADHVRGLLTVEGYLAARYGQSVPISVVARIRFEQEHGATGGDSASAAELFALLSALAQVPIRCSLAVTGAAGQYGEIQPIGGVNTKIVGFYEICKARRAAGEAPDGGHGVIIPAVNARDLMLPPEVARSIAAEGWFHIWPISTVDEGLQLLTGLPAAAIHERVGQRLKRFHELATRRGSVG